MRPDRQPLAVGDRVRLPSGHVDPTVALQDRMHLVHGDEVLDNRRWTCAAGDGRYEAGRTTVRGVVVTA